MGLGESSDRTPAVTSDGIGEQVFRMTEKEIFEF